MIFGWERPETVLKFNGEENIVDGEAAGRRPGSRRLLAPKGLPPEGRQARSACRLPEGQPMGGRRPLRGLQGGRSPPYEGPGGLKGPLGPRSPKAPKGPSAPYWGQEAL